MLSSLIEFPGRFHPVLVHLPIGVLFVAILLIWLSEKEQYSISLPLLKVVVLFGVLSAFAACVTGYLLSNSGDYDGDLIDWHMWMGLGVLAVSVFLYVQVAYSTFKISQKVLGLALFILIGVTGHLGGSLTHGADYLSFSLTASADTSGIIKPIANVQEANAYAAVIQPMLTTKCYGCHGPNKQKGGFRMDSPASLMKGGKKGVNIVPGKADESELVKRLLLPAEDKKHMAPKEKPQLDEKQIAMIAWWIDQGASFDKKVKDLPQTEKINLYLLALQSAAPKKEALATIPQKTVEAADNKLLTALDARGVVILPVAKNSNYLMASFVTSTEITDADLRLLLPLKEQLIWLKLGRAPVTDASLTIIGQCTGLTVLHLNNTLITDQGLASLKTLSRLNTLNLVGTKVTEEGLKQLQGLKQLRFLYLYQTQVNRRYWSVLEGMFPKTRIDSGGYVVRTLATDTLQKKDEY
ncbi:c-type cytochrome domain-containing protein [Daejeonella sp.]|uniref:c-type cytochrome domain-containing protein n=1 Tax=Daejeonella sp. TaxID=2805397 RepID=UPI00398362F5